jgi:hypothetical protein
MPGVAQSHLHGGARRCGVHFVSDGKEAMRVDGSCGASGESQEGRCGDEGRKEKGDRRVGWQEGASDEAR